MSDTQTPAPAAADDGKRKQIAKHGYLNAKGEPTKKIEEAVGSTYLDIESGKTVQYTIPGATAGTPQAMLGVFGLKTKMTNEASAWRQARERGDDDIADSQVAAIEECLLSIDGGVWREPGEAGARGPKYDKDVLAAALLAELGSKAKGDVVAYRERLDDKSYYAKVRSQPAVMARYYQELAARGKAPDASAADSLA